MTLTRAECITQIPASISYIVFLYSFSTTTRHAGRQATTNYKAGHNDLQSSRSVVGAFPKAHVRRRCSPPPPPRHPYLPSMMPCHVTWVNWQPGSAHNFSDARPPSMPDKTPFQLHSHCNITKPLLMDLHTYLHPSSVCPRKKNHPPCQRAWTIVAALEI